MLQPTGKKRGCYLCKHTVVCAAAKVCDSEP